MDPDIHNLTLATKRTILSDSNRNDSSSAPPVPSAAVTHGIDIADVWQFVLNSHQLDRFTQSKFLPAATVYGIGEGACYRVDKCELSHDKGRVVAVKYLKVTEQAPSNAESDENNISITTVLRELRILTHDPIRNSPNIVRLLGYGSRSVSGQLSLYLVAEFATFGTLRDYLIKKPNGAVSITEKIKFCHDLASGVAVLHSCGVVQGDLKLENTLVFTSDSGELLVKLSDFGHSILDDKSRYIGTAIFNAPEVRRGCLSSTARVDHYRCDIFSYGLMVWEIIQDGRRYVDFTKLKDPLVWLNELPKDDLLLKALLATQDLLPADASKIDFFQSVLEYTLKDNSNDRRTIDGVMKLFNSERPFVSAER
jgi:serine/threonine protein kinase